MSGHAGARGYNPGRMETIRASLPCYRCGYDLTGQPVEGRCPECTFAVVASLGASVEHTQHQLVALRSPRRVAAAIFACGLATLMSVALQLGAPTLFTIDSVLGRTSRLPFTMQWIAWIGSGVLVAIAAVALHLALSPREAALRKEVGRWRRWLLAGAWAWAAAATLAAVLQSNQIRLPDPVRNALPWAGVAVQLPGMAAMLTGLHVLLAITGRRSQAFSEAKAARQSVQLLNTTAALALVFAVASPILQFKLGWIWLAYTSRALAACMAALLIFGAAYLVANVWWVARALVLPPIRPEQVLDP